MKKYIIIGSGSKLYRKLNFKKKVKKEYRTSELDTYIKESKESDIVIVFSLLDGQEIIRISKETSAYIVIVGSCSAISPLWYRFKYSRIKRNQLKKIKNFPQKNLKYLIFGEFFIDDNRKGLRYYSSPNSFLEDCEKAVKSPTSIQKYYTITGESNKTSKLIEKIEKIAAPLSTLLIKKLTNYIYGYSIAYKK